MENTFGDWFLATKIFSFFVHIVHVFCNSVLFKSVFWGQSSTALASRNTYKLVFSSTQYIQTWVKATSKSDEAILYIHWTVWTMIYLGILLEEGKTPDLGVYHIYSYRYLAGQSHGKTCYVLISLRVMVIESKFSMVVQNNQPFYLKSPCSRQYIGRGGWFNIGHDKGPLYMVPKQEKMYYFPNLQ